MAVAHNGASSGVNNNASTASTTVSFQVPPVVTAGDIWICSVAFRGGVGTGTSGIPANFHLVRRTDSGGSATNVTIISYWYLATGSETGLFASITIAASSKYATSVDPFSGCNTTTPVTGTIVSQTGTSGVITTTALAALGTGHAVYAYGGAQGTSTLTQWPQSAANDGTSGTAEAASGGASATQLITGSAWLLAATDATSQTWNFNAAGSTEAIHAFILAPAAAAAAPAPNILFARQAVARASTW